MDQLHQLLVEKYQDKLPPALRDKVIAELSAIITTAEDAYARFDRHAFRSACKELRQYKPSQEVLEFLEAKQA